MKAFFTVIGGIAVLLGLFACVPSDTKVAAPKGFTVASYCQLKAGNLQTVRDGLNRADQCMQLACRITDQQTIEIAGYGANWLYSGPNSAPNKQFTLLEAKAFQAEARTRAIAATPVGKQLLHIQYFWDLVTPNIQGNEYLGANAQYGVCNRTGWVQTK